jgi:hypothetical protein
MIKFYYCPIRGLLFYEIKKPKIYNGRSKKRKRI